MKIFKFPLQFKAKFFFFFWLFLCIPLKLPVLLMKLKKYKTAVGHASHQNELFLALPNTKKTVLHCHCDSL